MSRGIFQNAFLKSTKVFTFLRGIAIDQSKVDKKMKNKNEGKFHEEVAGH